MEPDIFSDFISSDGSPHLGRNVIIQSYQEQDSSSSPFFNASQGTIDKQTERINNVFKEKYRKLKKAAKAYIFENASLCDEVARMQQKIFIAKEERRFLLKKYLNFQTLKDGSAQTNSVSSLPSTITSTSKGLIGESVEPPIKKKNPTKKRPPAKNSSDNIKENPKPRPKKKKLPADRRIVTPIPLDTTGRPIFPILLGPLTIHSLGVIVPDRPGFHTENCIYPIGFCSSRTYASLKNPTQQCLYQCTITDSPFGPKFEITPEDGDGHSLIASSINDVHSALLKSINAVCGKEVVSTDGQGAKFFGLSHSTVQNLIQSCAGARKCTDYRWIQFEVAKLSDAEEHIMKDYDPTINFDVLLHMVTESL